MVPDGSLVYPDSITLTQKCGCGNIYIRIWEPEGQFQRVFIQGSISKTQDCGYSWMEAMAGIITFSLRRAIAEALSGPEVDSEPIESGIIKQLKYQGCNKKPSCAHGIAKALEKYLSMRGWIDEKEEVTKQEAEKVPL
jgi:hypothetical protein